jgi:hypothetical protein
MKEKLKKTWKWFQGKKRSIGVIGLSVCSLKLVENNINVDVVEALKLGFTVIGGLGILYAGDKDAGGDKSIMKKFQDNLNNVTKQTKK